MHTHTIVDSDGKFIAYYSGPSEHAAFQAVFGRQVIDGPAPSVDHTWDGTQWEPPTIDVALASAKTTKLDELHEARRSADTVVKATGESVRKTAHLNGHEHLHKHLKTLVAAATSFEDLSNIRWTPAEHFHAALDKAAFPPNP